MVSTFAHLMESRHREQQSPNIQEQTIWNEITKGFQSLQSLRQQNETQTNKVNKAHEKVRIREASNESFTIKAGIRLTEMYHTSIDLAELENKYTIQ
jgi:hypothetical protein